MNRVSEILGIEKPIIQAPMSWVTSAELVAAVSNAGGLGILGPHAGQNTASTDPEEIGERLRKEIQKTKRLTNKPFGVNYSLGWGRPEEHPISNQILKVCIEENMKVLAVVGAPNEQVIKMLKELEFTVIFREGNPTVAGAKAAEAAGADMIVATGFEAGGGIPSGQIGTLTIVPLIADAVSIPVVATGGIVDKRTVNAAFALGAEGVYLGTKFIVTQESRANEATKQDIIKHGSEEVLLVKTPYGLLRSTPHALAVQASKENSNAIIGTDAFKLGLLDGRLEEGILTISNAIGQIKEIKTCKEIVEELMEDVMAAR